MFMCIYVYMYIVFVTSLWDALYNFINELAKPFRLEAEELKITLGRGGGGVRAPAYVSI